MSNLLASLRNSAEALNAFDQVLQVTQNNVANAGTPGYAKQTQDLWAKPFDPNGGLAGGVKAGDIVSARNQYAEQSVRQQTALLGGAQQSITSLTSLQSVFDVSDGAGIPSALNGLFQSFSAWGQTPDSTVARQTVLERATDVANAFQRTATGLGQVAQDTESQLQQTVTQVNQIVGQLQGFNKQILNGDRNDPGLDAEVNSLLEQLSQYISFTAAPQADGSVTVLLNGQTALLVGDKQYGISFQMEQPDNPPPTYPDGPAKAHVLSAGGADVTAATTGGQLGALVNIRNNVLPSYIGDAYNAGSLNALAKQFAGRINDLLTGGNLDDGDPANDVPPTKGVPLFTYDLNNDTNVASTLAVSQTITPDQLAAIDPSTTPEVSNGIPLKLSGLANPQDAVDQIDGQSYTEYYGGLASSIGSALNAANNQQQVQQSAVAQAQNLRQQLSGVNVDEEAMVVIQFQRAYEANARLITVLDQLTQDTINILNG